MSEHIENLMLAAGALAGYAAKSTPHDQHVPQDATKMQAAIIAAANEFKRLESNEANWNKLQARIAAIGVDRTADELTKFLDHDATCTCSICVVRVVAAQLLVKSVAAADRLAELEAIVAKLPKTADGIPITPGMVVWEIINYPVGTHCIDNAIVSGEEVVILVDAETDVVRASECYSTREAAEASKGTK